MRLGIKEIKDFFSNKYFKWFDRKEVRDQEFLSEKDLKYIKGWTIAPFGYGFIFYFTRRILPDLLTVYLITFVYFKISDKFFDIQAHSIVTDILVILIGVLELVMILAWLYTLYFTYRHGKRLSWNRGRRVYKNFRLVRKNFENVDELRKSEKNFVRWNTIPTLILLLALVIFLFVLHSRIDLRQIDNSSNSDQEGLKAFSEQGFNPNAEYEITFYLYFESQQEAQNADIQIRNEWPSLVPDIHKTPLDKTWTLEYKGTMIPSIDRLGALRATFEKTGANYDGWEIAATTTTTTTTTVEE